MILQKSEFKFVDRSFKETIVLIPGWATDYRIFSRLELNYNYLLPVKFYPFGFIEALLKQLDVRGIDKVSLFGWSLGGFLASDFSLANPERINKLIYFNKLDTSKRQNEIILVSICNKFNSDKLEVIREKISKNKKAYLYKFYIDCFFGDNLGGYAWFKDNLLKDYFGDMDLEYLNSGLDYFLQSVITTESLCRIKNVRIFHGAKDKIVSFKEAAQTWGRFSKANRHLVSKVEFISLPESGHIPFLSRDFRERFENG